VSAGTFSIQPGEDTVADLLERAGGLTELAQRDGIQLLRVPRTPTSQAVSDRLAESSISSLKAIEGELYRVEERRWPHAVQLAAEDAGATLVEDHDVLYVPRRLGSVLVDGRVVAPGFIRWRPDWRLRDYIEAAGGFDDGANSKQILVQRLGSPGHLVELDGGERLVDGDRVWVPERAPRDLWRLTREAVQFLAQIATVVIIIDQAVGN